MQALTEKEWPLAESPRSRRALKVARSHAEEIGSAPDRLRSQQAARHPESRPARVARYSETLMSVGVMSAPRCGEVRWYRGGFPFVLIQAKGFFLWSSRSEHA